MQEIGNPCWYWYLSANSILVGCVKRPTRPVNVKLGIFVQLHWWHLPTQSVLSCPPSQSCPTRPLVSLVLPAHPPSQSCPTCPPTQPVLSYLPTQPASLVLPAHPASQSSLVYTIYICRIKAIVYCIPKQWAIHSYQRSISSYKSNNKWLGRNF